MTVIKHRGNILGAQLNKNEQKALDIEITKQLVARERSHMMEIDAVILWVLHRQCGWGEKRLKRFYMEFESRCHELFEYYQMEEKDLSWLCKEKLKDIGVDVEAWYTEVYGNE